jgi:tetratricopeptide (TPR) repeat protein
LSHIDESLAFARRHVDSQRWREAIPALEEVLGLTPRNPDALYLMGVCCGSMDDPASLSQGVAYLSRALDAGFNPSWVLLFRSQAYLRLGNFDAAERDVDAAPCRDSRDAAIAATRTVVLRQCRSARIESMVAVVRGHLDAQNYEEALNAVAAVFEVDPENATASYLQAFALQAGFPAQAAAAAAAYQRALDRGFDPFWVYYNRAQLRLALGDVQRARADLAMARNANPSHEGLAQVAALIEMRLLD